MSFGSIGSSPPTVSNPSPAGPTLSAKRASKRPIYLAVCGAIGFTLLVVVFVGALVVTSLLPKSGAVPVEDFECKLTGDYQLLSIKGARFIVVGPNDTQLGRQTVVPLAGQQDIQVSRIGVVVDRYIVGITSVPYTGANPHYFVIDSVERKVDTGMSPEQFAEWSANSQVNGQVELHYSVQCYNGLPKGTR